MFLSLFFRIFESKTSSFESALSNGDLQQEIPIAPAQNLFVCGSGILPYDDSATLDRLITKGAVLSGGG